MALINCPECSKRISDQSITCPSCGFPTARAVPPPISREGSLNNKTELLAKKPQVLQPTWKDTFSRRNAIALSIVISVSFLGIFIIGNSEYDEKISHSVPKPPQFNIERNTVEEPVSTSETFLSIPMSDSFENGRYFLTSLATEEDIENIEYIRKGNDNTSYGKMEIKCSDNQVRKYSADNFNALQSADMGDWFTPAPDWTDQDIVNFVCGM